MTNSIERFRLTGTSKPALRKSIPQSYHIVIGDITGEIKAPTLIKEVERQANWKFKNPPRIYVTLGSSRHIGGRIVYDQPYYAPTKAKTGGFIIIPRTILKDPKLTEIAIKHEFAVMVVSLNSFGSFFLL